MKACTTSKELTAQLNELKKRIARVELAYQNALARKGERNELTRSLLNKLTLLTGYRDGLARLECWLGRDS
jgi:hypothetical protein